MGLLNDLGGVEGCRGLAADFYRLVGSTPELKRLFPGKNLRCATEEFAAFLIQFLGGDEIHTQKRWWLSLAESHARFVISPSERDAWLRQMAVTLEAAPLDEATRNSLNHLFAQSSAYLLGQPWDEQLNGEVYERWAEQLELDRVLEAISLGNDQLAISLSTQFSYRPSVFAGLLDRMIRCGRPDLIRFVIGAVESDSSLLEVFAAGRTLLHVASGAGCVEVARLLLDQGADPNGADLGGHFPLYYVGNQCPPELGAEMVRELVKTGAELDAIGGVTKATALHMAARRGNVEVAKALLAAGASPAIKDRKGVTPLQRAINCRKPLVVQLLQQT